MDLNRWKSFCHFFQVHSKSFPPICCLPCPSWQCCLLSQTGSLQRWLQVQNEVCWKIDKYYCDAFSKTLSVRLGEAQMDQGTRRLVRKMAVKRARRVASPSMRRGWSPPGRRGWWPPWRRGCWWARRSLSGRKVILSTRVPLPIIGVPEECKIKWHVSNKYIYIFDTALTVVSPQYFKFTHSKTCRKNRRWTRNWWRQHALPC